MRARARILLPFLATMLSAATAAAAAQGLVGNVARQVDVIALFFGGVGTGASIAALAVSLRSRRPPASDL